MKQDLSSLFLKTILTGTIVCIGLTSCTSTPAAPAVTVVPPPTSAPVEITQTAAPTAAVEPSLEPTAPLIPSVSAPGLAVPAILKMLDSQTGWMVNEDGRVYHTSAGMQGWVDVTPEKAPLPEAGAITQLPAAYFLSSNNAWLAYTSPDNAGLLILRTRDGGTTWKDDSKVPENDFGGMIAPISMQFINTQNGWLWAQIYPGMNHVYPALFHTTDAGQNWQLVYDPSPAAEVPNDTLKGAYSLPFGAELFTFVDPLNGFAGTGLLLATHDGGKNWATLSLPKPTGLAPIKDPYVYVAPPEFNGSKDGVVPVYIFESESVYNPPGDMFTDMPAVSYFAWTHNGGQSWKSLPMPGRIGTIGLADGKTAWFLGKSDPDPAVKPRMYLTQDGGETWMPWGVESPLPLGSQMQFTGRTTGYALAPLYGSRDLFKKFESRIGDKGYFYQLNDWAAVELTLPQP